MVAFFFVPVVVVVVVSIAERKRESVRERETSAGNIQTERKRAKRGKGTQKPPKRHAKTLPLSLPTSLFSLFCLSEVNERERTEVNERKEE